MRFLNLTVVKTHTRCDITERTELLLKINILIICNNNKDYMSLGIGMCILSRMYLIALKNIFLLYCIYLITMQTMVTVGMIPRSVNLLIDHV